MSGLMSGIWKRGLRYRARSRLYTPGIDKKMARPEGAAERGFALPKVNPDLRRSVCHPFRVRSWVGSIPAVKTGLKPQAQSFHPFRIRPTDS